MEQKICQVCQIEYTIETSDMEFYAKMKVPPPTFCPDCRMQRRFSWRNERSLYHRVCEATGEKLISAFSSQSGVHVFEREYWWSDAWDPKTYAKEYDFSKPFFTQFKEFLNTVPLPATFSGRSVNTFYCNHVGSIKDSYLTFASWSCERVMHCAKAQKATDTIDCLKVDDTEFGYECIASQNLHKSRYILNSDEIIDSAFLYDCRNCTNCFMSSNLRNKSYVFRNQQLSKEEYKKQIALIDFGSYQETLGLVIEFKKMIEVSLHVYAVLIQTEKSTGNNLVNTYNCKSCFDVFDDVKDCKWAIHGGMNIKENYDCYGMGAGAELLYESFDVGDGGHHYLGDIVVWVGINVSYSINCHGCTDCFGCIGLRNAKNCIFNKQYTKEEYEALLPKVIAHMNEMPYIDQKGRSYGHGEFFPTELAPFSYNETIAQEYVPLVKDEAIALGFSWRDPEDKNYSVTQTYETLHDNISDIDETILDEIIGCIHDGLCNQQCTKAFKITKEELAFYKRLNIPIPRLCPNCRHYERLAYRTPYKLWHRKCDCQMEGHDHVGECEVTFETPYAPDRAEKIFCEKCYLKEIF